MITAIALNLLVSLVQTEKAVHQTAHFELTHDLAPAEAKEIAAILETTHDAVLRFLHELGIPPKEPTSRLRVRLFTRIEDFQVELQAHGLEAKVIAGLYVPEKNETLLLRPECIPAIEAIDRELKKTNPPAAAELRTRRDQLIERVRRLTIAHEAAHHLLFNVGPLDRNARYPAWLLEGLACQFESTPNSSDREADLPKKLNPIRIGELLNARTLEGPTAPESYALAQALVAYLRRAHPEFLKEQLNSPPTNEPNAILVFERRAQPIDNNLAAKILQTSAQPKSGN